MKPAPLPAADARLDLSIWTVVIAGPGTIIGAIVTAAVCLVKNGWL